MGVPAVAVLSSVTRRKAMISVPPSVAGRGGVVPVQAGVSGFNGGDGDDAVEAAALPREVAEDTRCGVPDGSEAGARAGTVAEGAGEVALEEATGGTGSEDGGGGEAGLEAPAESGV